ncbi:hypothetical protein RI129_012601 [Pyrocoelia pectoralis]|uniref:Glucose-methanol-choline oxidoreductase N-terminal domain-containing protein n=1 Tax=Pyrocoelia pectoralis TaxID=417401 RepID=A0AAN7V361_9COLE
MNVVNPCPATLTGASSHMFMTLINTLLTSQCLLSPKDLYPTDYGPSLKSGDEFDFIVIGAGSAGSIVADRLSENPNWKVLLLEAGGYPSSSTEIPGIALSLLQTDEDWGYDFELSKTSCLGMKNPKCPCPRGKVLGGTSSINGMLYARGHRKDFDQFAEDGNIGWDYDTILKHFEKIEDLQDVKDEGYGKGGDLKLSYYENPQPIHKSLISGYKELGYGTYSYEKPIGHLTIPTTVHGGLRYSAAKAFLAKGKTRQNLHVALHAQVSRLLIAPDLSVTGVEVRVNGQLLHVNARKEVVLSAGAVNSPQILMNSGIGPQDHLNEIGIPVVKNLKVGQNLQDHLLFLGLLLAVNDDAFVQKTSTDVVDDLYQFFRHRSGPLGRAGMVNSIFFFNTKNNSGYPNMHLYSGHIHKNDPHGGLKVFHKSLNFPDEVVQVQSESNKDFHSIILLPGLSHPKSRGQILLRSKDPFDTPRIVSNLLSDENGEDLQILLESIRFVQNLIRTDALSSYKAKIVYPNLVNCRGFEVDSDDYWRCSLRNMVTTSFHLVGTCKMGPKIDPDAVVDSRLRVHGIKGIRVIDASIMPKMISCVPNAAVIMIGEKGAGMIKEDWREGHNEL